MAKRSADLESSEFGRGRRRTERRMVIIAFLRLFKLAKAAKRILMRVLAWVSELMKSKPEYEKHDVFLGLITRCKDEYFIEEFCDHYLSQGVDEITIIDDDSVDKTIYRNLKSNPKINILWEKSIIKNDFVSTFYMKIRDRYEWLIYVDVDEFITTKHDSSKTIREELASTFQNADCVKIPWVMMSCNGIKESPRSVLNTNVFRWNHDKKHPNDVHKFRCRYARIEVKCIFRPSRFKKIGDHHPFARENKFVRVVDGVKCQPDKISSFYDSLRESDIATGYLLCYHYRIISQENNINKLKTNYWYINDGYTLDDLMSSDHPEVIDRRLATKG